MTVVLLVGTGLMSNSFLRLTRVDPGFEIRNVLIVPIELPAVRYPDASEARSFVVRLIERLRRTSGVRSAGAVSHLPLGGSDNWMMLEIEGRETPARGQEPQAPVRVVTPEYFETLGIPLIQGRVFRDTDARLAVPLVRWYPEQPYPAEFDRPQPAPVAVISETAARQFWSDEDPIGKRIRVLFSPHITIVGVVGDIRHNALNEPVYPHIYLSHNQEPWGSLSVAVRAADSDPSIGAAVREHLRALDPALPVAIRKMEDVRSASVGQPRFFMLFTGLFGAVALGLAIVGIVGVVSYLAAQRTREIGVRIALGAERREIVALVMRDGIRPIAIGLAAGILGAIVVTRSIESMLFDVKPADPLTFAAVVLLLGLVAMVACLLPARKAARLSPIVALHED
jgi:putative ABC transport system permease protein